jgi:dTDP-4-dehydrorhamnose reductase
MRIIVAGARGMLAQDLVSLLEKEHETLCPAEKDLDITDQKRVLDVIGDAKPDLVINCAAYNQVDEAETDRKAAFAVNAYGVKNLAAACRETESILCHFSTDYVFDGKKTQPYQPDDSPNPISVYGESKRAGEVFLQSELKDRYYLVRTSSLYGRHGPNFVYTILRLAEKNETLTVVDDQLMSPTWTVNLAQGVVELIRSGRFGTYHLTDRTAGGVTWFDFAKEILNARGLDTRIEPMTSREFNRPARRPAYSVLDSTGFTLSSGYEPLQWQESLRRFLNMI